MYIYEKEKMPIPEISGHPDWIEIYDAAWQTAFKNVEYLSKDGWKPQLTCMPGSGIVWQWDSCFMTFITNYSNGTISAFNNLDNLYRLRRESDGYMSMAYIIENETEAYGERINPPLMAWSEWEYYRVTGDSSRFENVLPALEGIFSFIENNRRRNLGLYWFEDSGSSGMDTSPRGGYFSSHLDGCDICHVDLACQQALSARCLSDICGVLGKTEKQSFYKAEHERICELINRYHWSEKSGWYFDFFAREDASKKVKFINSKTAAAFWAIISGCATGQRLERMIEHMFNEDEFYTLIPFASLSKDDPNYDKNGGYWLGGVWPPTNYAAIRGLYDTGYFELAREAAVKFLDAMCKVRENPAWGSIWEAYAPEDYRPSTREAGNIVKAEFVGWSGLAPITMLIEQIIGLHFDAPKNEVIFRPFPMMTGGLRNMQFNGGKISIVCTEYNSALGKSTVSVEAEKPFTLIVRANYRYNERVIEVTPGKHEFEF